MKLTKKNKRTKRDKKQIGGNGSGYTIVGFTGKPMNQSTNGRIASEFTGRMVGSMPICLPNHEIPGSLYSRMGQVGVGGQFIILPQLYKLDWVHGKLNLYDVLRNEIMLCDKNENNIFKHGGKPPPSNTAELNSWLEEKDTWDEATQRVIGKSRKDVITEIEIKYPGLFMPIFVDDRYHYVHNDLFVNAI